MQRESVNLSGSFRPQALNPKSNEKGKKKEKKKVKKEKETGNKNKNKNKKGGLNLKAKQIAAMLPLSSMSRGLRIGIRDFCSWFGFHVYNAFHNFVQPTCLFFSPIILAVQMRLSEPLPSTERLPTPKLEPTLVFPGGVPRIVNLSRLTLGDVYLEFGHAATRLLIAPLVRPSLWILWLPSSHLSFFFLLLFVCLCLSVQTR